MTDFEGFDELADELDSFATQARLAATLLPRAIDTGVETTARDVQTAASVKAPKDTNRLANSIHADRLEPMHWVVGTDLYYAKEVEFGTGPHPITPDEKKALKFTDGGEVVFASRVMHPGTPAQPYLRPALLEHQSDLVENIEEAIEELFLEVFA